MRLLTTMFRTLILSSLLLAAIAPSVQVEVSALELTSTSAQMGPDIDDQVSGANLTGASSDVEIDEKAASKMEEEVLSQLRGDPTEPVTVIVHLGGEADLRPAANIRSKAERADFVYQTLRAFADQSQADLRVELSRAQRSGEVLDYRPYFIFNGIAVTAQAQIIWRIAARDDVQTITANHTYELDQENDDPSAVRSAINIHQTQSLNAPGSAEWNISQISADQVWAQYGVTGEGVLVANLDSGVDYTHPALVEGYAGNLGGGNFDHDFHWYDAVNGNSTPYDDNNHGTHTMGTAVGGDGPGPFVDDIGVAPGATWIAVKAFSAFGTGDSDDIHAAFEWLLAPCPVGVPPGDPSCDPAKAPAVINNSWGSSNGSRTEFLDDVIALRAAGILPAFSAGNNGPNSGTIGSPASFAQSLATGATDSSDLIADFSSRGPSPLTNEIKPDVVAPGVNIRSSIPGGGYISYNGTSMACPHSVGLAALMLSADPSLDLDTLEGIITSSTLDLGSPGPDMDYGYGRIDALSAIERILSSGTLSGTVQEDGTLLPIGDVQVRAMGQGLDVSTTSAGDGSYVLDYLISGTYTVTAAYYGYEPITITNVLIVTDTVTVQDINLIPLPHYTLSGHVYDAISTTVPVTNAMVSVLNTPLPPTNVDDSGFYSMTVAEGTATIEAAAFGYATGITQTLINTDTVLDFYLDPLPPILLVDDDEGDLRSYSPHVEKFYFLALDSNGYNYTYWDIEDLGSPGFDTVRQYAAVVWFGGEFGRIKDISDADQAQVIMDYLDLGGRFFYIAQEHTFYYGDDADCDTPTWGGTGPCPFTKNYLGVADWVEDQRAQVAYGVSGNPVGEGLGPIVMDYPPGLTDFSDDILGNIQASLAFSATDSNPPGEINLVAYTVISSTVDFKTVFFATPLEGMPPADAADVTYAVMEWFGVSGLAEGLTLSPPLQEGLALPGETLTYTIRLRNLSPFPDTFDLAVIAAPWVTQIWDAGFNNNIDQIGPVDPGETADFGISVEIPPGTTPGAETTSRIQAVSQSGTPHSAEAEMISKSRMVYYFRDSDQCDSGVHFEWVDATSGTRWDLDDSPPLPEFVPVPLPAPFTYYNQTYDHLWINDHATVLFGDDNIYDDQFPTGNPPIPNPTITDPNGAIYLAWGTSFWHPSDQDPDAAVYTYHDTSGGRNWFVIEYHKYENLLGGGPDTFEAILDLDTNEITVQYMTITYSNFAVVGIENQIGTEGILYVNDQQPPEHIIHDGLAIHYGVGNPPDVIEIDMQPPEIWGTGDPDGAVTYTLTLNSSSSITDSYTLETLENNWPTTLWDASFSNQISELGPLTPCTSIDFGVQVELPPDVSYVKDQATVRARSKTDTLVTASSLVTTDNADPQVAAGPDSAGGAYSGQQVAHTLWVTNTGNITDVYSLSLSGYTWPTSFQPALTQTDAIPPGDSQTITVQVSIPANVYAGMTDNAILDAASQYYPGTQASASITSEALPNRSVTWEADYQEKTGPSDWTVGYFATVRNTGNLDEVFHLESLAADWNTTIWNESFTEQITKTVILAPDGTQRIGVRVYIPDNAAPPDQDASLLIATSSSEEDVSAASMLLTEVDPLPPGQHGVLVTPSGAWGSTAPGDTITYTLRVTNTGTVTDSFTLQAIEGRWLIEHPVDLIDLPPGEGIDVEIAVTPPHYTVGPNWDQASILITSQGNPGYSDRADLITLAPGVQIVSPAVAAGPNQSDSAFPGETIRFSFSVTNTGNISDAYDLSLSGSTWSTNFAPGQTDTLQPGDAQTITVDVVVPLDAPPFTEDTATLTAVSRRFSGVEAAVTLTSQSLPVEAVLHQIYLPALFQRH